MRQKLIAGNWKMYKTGKEAREFVTKLSFLVCQAPCRVLLAVPFTAIESAKEAALGSLIEIGAQNMHDAIEGAFTGEICSRMLKEAGATFVLLGHSERRHHFHETNAFIHRKLKRALAEDLQPILCIGETESQREAGKTQEVLYSQLAECLQNLTSQEMQKIILAYEPVWAIGTGRAATSQMAQEVHLLCRRFLENQYDVQTAKRSLILYGGSVKPENINDLIEQPDIDGALVGGASLEASSFAQIINFKVKDLLS